MHSILGKMVYIWTYVAAAQPEHCVAPLFLQFAELAQKIAELEAGEAQRSAQLQPLMARQPVPQAWPQLTSPGDKTAAGKYTRSYT